MNKLMKAVGGAFRTIADSTPVHAPPTLVTDNPPVDDAPITDRATAYRMAMTAACNDNRSTRQIIAALGMNRTCGRKLLTKGKRPNDKILGRLCSEYGIKIDITPLPSAQKTEYVGLEGIPLRPLVQARKPKSKKGMATLKPCSARQNALLQIFEAVKADDRTVHAISKALSIKFETFRSVVVHGKLPSDRTLAKMAKGYGIDLDLKTLGHRRFANPHHYEGFAALPPRADAINDPVSAPDAVCNANDEPARSIDTAAPILETPGLSVDFDLLDRQLNTLEAMIATSRLSAQAAAQLPAAQAEIAALKIDNAAGRAREHNLQQDLAKALARAEAAENLLGKIRDHLPDIG